MNEQRCSQALQYVRKLRGGSQPILLKASDGLFYVVKFFDNLQGPNVLFNEALGTELFRRVGIPVPEWRLVHVSEDFLDRNPGCWMETEDGRHKPRAGWCFGSQFLGLKNGAIFEILPQGSFNRIQNRMDFCAVWVLDTICGHTDNRQAIFVEEGGRQLKAYFIDHGHLFGGAEGTAFPSFLASRFLDPRIYVAANIESADNILRAIQSIDLAALTQIAMSLPDEWKTATALLRFEQFAERIVSPSHLRGTIHFILSSAEHSERQHGRIPKQDATRFKCEDLCAQIP